MTQKMSFSEYCKSKEYLRLAAESIPQFVVEYELNKYCKFPIVASEDGDRTYVAFKPKDRIAVLWEYLNPENPVPRSVTVTTDDESDSKVQPAWSNSKLSSWISKNTSKKPE